MNRKIILKNIILVFHVMFFLLLFSCKGTREITENELRDHVIYLSSDSLKGRESGTESDSLAAHYIMSEFLEYELKPLKDDGFQRFRIIKDIVPGKNNYLSVNGISFKTGQDFIPMSFSSDSEMEAEVIFAGYGFNIDEDSLHWNDYTNIDVLNRWVMILRADPETGNPASRFIPYSGDYEKVLAAKDKGAAGVLMVSGASFDPQDEFEQPDNESYSAGIPVIRIKRNVADIILKRSGFSVSVLEQKLNEAGKALSFNTGIKIKAGTEVIRRMNTTRNVVMLLEGEDKQMKNEYLIIGAHYDHLGMGGKGSSSRQPDTVAVHHGADDNASGVAMMIELAEKFARTRGSHKRSIVFIAFSAEELGIVGSRYFVSNPGIDLSHVNAMINLDMVGRMDEKILQVSGTGTSDIFKDLLVQENDSSIIKLTISEEGYGPSDHSSFYGKDIPVLFFSTGAHLDYHMPADTYDKLDYGSMVNIGGLVFDVAERLANDSARLVFREAGPKTETGRMMRRRSVTLGIMPDFAGNVKNGLRADLITPGRPAALGGMKKGDIITAINGMNINNIQDYMFRMGQLKPGQTISVELLRENKKMVLLIQL